MSIEAIEKELRRYGTIVNRIDWTEHNRNHTLKLYFLDSSYFMVKMENGIVRSITEVQYIDYKVVGQDKVAKVCCICGEEFIGYGNNPQPVMEKGRCCDRCNSTVVIPKRMEDLK